jgi:uncharacterized lipoprotein YehR (DUF1307 family)
MHFDYVVYKLTFPNGKIYVGKDVGGLGHAIRYFGSWNNELVEKDFTKDQLRDLTIRKEILFESNDKKEIGLKEGEFIRILKSNDISIGYNQSHRKRTLKSDA